MLSTDRECNCFGRSGLQGGLTAWRQLSWQLHLLPGQKLAFVDIIEA